MSRLQTIRNPFLLGFDDLERVLDNAGKVAGDGYPPYNIERMTARDGELIRIVLAVAGFTKDQLDITLEGNQLIITGKQENDKSRLYLYRGIAARQFQRGFLLADGLTVQSASLSDGLLAVELWRPAPSRQTSRIEIRERD
jgi:HSP20 family molecular chaperone IbpA